MKYIHEYRDKGLVEKLVHLIRVSSKHKIALMEVCGGHTAAIHRFGIKSLLPETIRLFSGPGCPVCVTGTSYIDKAIWLSREKDMIITTFGDLIRVPGSSSTLEAEKSDGRDIRIVYSVLDSLKIARQNPDKNVVFLAIGFETTAPGTAAAIQQAHNQRFDNFFILNAHKVMPPAMSALVSEGIKIDGFICPGHVSTITGSKIYEFLPADHGIGCAIAGFEPLDILHAVYSLVLQLEDSEPKVEIAYKRAVTDQGNKKAQNFINTVFQPCNVEWRGLGQIPDSGLCLRKEYLTFDADYMFDIQIPKPKERPGCICGEILKGLRTPGECRLFGKSCTPQNPVGACMVSQEGACQAWYKYGE